MRWRKRVAALAAVAGLTACAARRPTPAMAKVSDEPPALTRPDGWADSRPAAADALVDWTLAEPVAMRLTLTRTEVPGLAEPRLAPTLAVTLTRDTVARWRDLGYALTDSVTTTMAQQTCHVVEARLASPDGGVWQKQYVFPRHTVVYVLTGTAPAAAAATAEPLLEQVAQAARWPNTE